jgi:hypothetical protein
VSALSPLPEDLLIVRDEPIILELDDEGMADTHVAHLPMEKRGTWRFDTLDGAYPSSWQSACGAVFGPVYNRGGCLEDIEICGACEAAA